jgi:hypothetical protein
MDRPLIRRTQPVDPRLDQWMLDRWSTPEQHVVSVVYRDRKHPDGRGGIVIDREYRSVCLCVCRSIETTTPSADCCPVADALADRLKRLCRAGERIEWTPYRTARDG